MTISDATLRKFCATEDDPFHYTHEPWYANGVILATNGHVLVEIKDDWRRANAGPEKSFPNVDKLFAENPGTDFIAIPPPSEPLICDCCIGSGKQIPIMEDDESVDTCLACNGSGEAMTRVRIGYADFQARYLRLLASLPNCTISPNGNKLPAAFRFDGGRGLLMPMRDKDA